MMSGILSTNAIYSRLGIERRLAELPVLALFNLVLIASAYVSIPLPWTPVPVTGQTFAVVLLAMSLGRVRALAITAAYLLEGGCGLPVFAGGASGIAALVGPTGGYLVGFLAAAGLVGWLADRGWDRSLGRSILAMTGGHAVIFALGLAQLSLFVPAGAVLASGLYPFLPGTVLKVALASGLLPAIWNWLDRTNSRQ